MSCYFRHLKDVFQELGIVVTKDKKRAIDEAIHGLVSVKYKNCSPTWKEIKERLKGDPKGRAEFLKALKGILSG